MKRGKGTTKPKKNGSKGKGAAVPTVTLEKRVFKSHLGGVYTGDADHLTDILNPHVANWLKNEATGFKAKIGAKCSTHEGKCLSAIAGTEYKYLDTAHPTKQSRPTVIRDVAKEFLLENKSCKIDEVFQEVKARHEQLKFALLCRTCHIKQKALKGAYEQKTLAEWSAYAASLSTAQE